MAVLIVLAQRAERARASFAWGILQEAPGALRTAVTIPDVRDLMASRRAASVADGEIARWLAADGVAGASEIWLVGPERLADRPRRPASVLAISDVLEPAASRISIKLSGSQGRRPRTVTLDVPEQRTAVRLLRDPLGAAVAARVTTLAGMDANSAIVFSMDGRRLHTRTADGGLLTVHIPNSPRATAGKPAIWRPPGGGTVLAVGAGLLKRHFAVLCRQGNDAVVHLIHKRGRSLARSDRVGVLEGGEPDGPLQPLAILRGPAQSGGSPLEGAHLCFVRGNGRLVLITAGRSFSHAQNVVAASRATRDAFVYVEHGVRAEVKVVRVNRNNDLELTTAAVELPHPSADTRYYFCPTAPAAGPANLVAWSPAESRCTTVHRQQTETFDVPRGHTVIGMIERWDKDRGFRPFVIAIDGDRTGIELLRPQERRRLLTTAAPIASAVAGDAGAVIVFTTQTGEFGIYCCNTQAMLLHMIPETTA